MKIAVYCSAKDSIPDDYKALGRQLGAWIGDNGHTLVYGGATGGLMTITSDTAKAHGATVIGVVPQPIIYKGRKADNCDELIVVANMSERKQTMRELADCFVCLPGSYGTLDEMMDVISAGIVGEHCKRTYVLNYKGFYEPLKAQIECMRSLSFIPEQEVYKPVFVDSLEELYKEVKKLKSRII